MAANGGGGAEAGTSLGGVNGSDGRADTVPAAGGSGGSAGAGNGGAGGASITLPLNGLPAGTNNEGGGGGGGAVGRIRINASGSCSIGGLISPPQTSNGACP